MGVFHLSGFATGVGLFWGSFGLNCYLKGGKGSISSSNVPVSAKRPPFSLKRRMGLPRIVEHFRQTLKDLRQTLERFPRTVKEFRRSLKRLRQIPKRRLKGLERFPQTLERCRHDWTSIRPALPSVLA
jgi:hypothetical protein